MHTLSIRRMPQNPQASGISQTRVPASAKKAGSGSTYTSANGTKLSDPGALKRIKPGADSRQKRNAGPRSKIVPRPPEQRVSHSLGYVQFTALCERSPAPLFADGGVTHQTHFTACG
jgi:hypothetical protein